MAAHTIIHVEIPADDPKLAADFYRQLFDWKTDTLDEFDYLTFDAQSGPAGAFPKIDHELYNKGDVTIYVSTDDIDNSLQKVEALGGKTLVPKTEIPNTGWYALFADPTGNRIGLYTSMDSSS